MYHPGSGATDRFRVFYPELGTWPDTWKCRNKNDLKHFSHWDGRSAALRANSTSIAVPSTDTLSNGVQSVPKRPPTRRAHAIIDRLAPLGTRTYSWHSGSKHLEGPPGKPEVAVRKCPHRGGKGNVNTTTMASLADLQKWEEDIKTSCRQVKTALEVMATFGGEEVIEI